MLELMDKKYLKKEMLMSGKKSCQKLSTSYAPRKWGETDIKKSSVSVGLRDLFHSNAHSVEAAIERFL